MAPFGSSVAALLSVHPRGPLDASPRRHPLSTATIGALVSSLHSGFGHQNGPCRRQSSAGVAFQTDWASSEQDRQRTRPTEDLCGPPLVDAAPRCQDCAAAGRHRACRRPESDGEKGCRCCCGLQGSCFEKGMAPNAVMRCRLAGLFFRNNSKQQQRLPTPTWSPVRGWRSGGVGGLLAPLLRPPTSQFTTNTSSKPGQTGTRPRRGKDPGFRPRLPAATTGARSKVSRREERALA